MATKEKTLITVQSTINAPIEKVWDYWTLPRHIVNWNFASDDWHCANAENDVKPGGKFSWRMEARDGSMAFDFSGTYVAVVLNNSLEIKLDDDRTLHVFFTENKQQTSVTEKFEAEGMNSVELQQQGWQAILDNFKKYVEQNI